LRDVLTVLPRKVASLNTKFISLLNKQIIINILK
jgi:hypothetical protein